MSEPFIGQIMPVGFNYPPRGWALCDGQLLPISEYTTLFALLGTTFGGDGVTTFCLPDLRGRVPIHPGTGSGLLTYVWGQRGGVEGVTLGVNQVPPIPVTGTAKIRCRSEGGDSNDPVDHSFALSTDDNYHTRRANADMAGSALSINLTANGGGQAHENRQPFLGIYFCIALVGLWPSRN